VTRVYLSLGSNIEPEKNLVAAIDVLREKFGDVLVSPTYRFRAVGFDGPDFLNLVAAIDTDMEAAALNDWLRNLENQQGRRRDVPRFSSRPLDIDIVLFGRCGASCVETHHWRAVEKCPRVQRSGQYRRYLDHQQTTAVDFQDFTSCEGRVADQE
jgi:2-amino-4-hydroxy-6-hydroxymethyldihydropteridine diphosphokinase